MAAELGFEPRQTESESAVLPLHNSAMDNVDYYTPFSKKVKGFLKIFLKNLSFLGSDVSAYKIKLVASAHYTADKPLCIGVFKLFNGQVSINYNRF